MGILFFRRKQTDKQELNARIDAYLAENYIAFESFNAAVAYPGTPFFGAAAAIEEASAEPAADMEAAECADESKDAAHKPGSAFAMPFMREKKSKRSLDEVISEVSESWQESLFRLIDEKGYSDTEVYKRAGIDRKLFSKIRCSRDYRPKKNTAIAFAIALRLNLDETKDFLMRAGFALSKSSRFDLIIQFFIENGIYDLITIETALYDHNEQALSS